MQDMQVNILNSEILQEMEPTFHISLAEMYEGYIKIFNSFHLKNINIIFIDSKYIQQLNRDYSGINIPTDVLSFDIEGEKKGGEIYICPEYIHQFFEGEEFEEEVLRLIIHGTLHILGFSHMKSMDDFSDEEMFLLQEELLIKYKKL
jgi:rRNA maturation RNase YbeY